MSLVICKGPSWPPAHIYTLIISQSGAPRVAPSPQLVAPARSTIRRHDNVVSRVVSIFVALLQMLALCVFSLTEHVSHKKPVGQPCSLRGEHLAHASPKTFVLRVQGTTRTPDKKIFFPPTNS